MPLSKKNLFISRLSLLVALAMVIQIIGLPQPVTGPLINLILFITATSLNWMAGCLLGSLTPLMALIRGQIPTVLGILVPFIATANVILVSVYCLFHLFLTRFSRLSSSLTLAIAIILAAISKYLFFVITLKFILPLIFHYRIPEPIAFIFMTPQLVTALIGGALFYFLMTILSKSGYLIHRD
ncbi:MAG: hypothetical protein ONB13_01020 [candidate division KSB1 bacterium]|nr:hypothetical protein [candidate division KSB1 bacterium]MDZ7335556.1 hypothetical protein [candidate division KSB1 bacterium]MDZ7356922.1 hypothetical protein [candidate division KSB1 bacterium]MDZ7375174.1 hypothetical protein [candidate division KSB1 bacterium]MDZ7399247.1 hypothetical protein [candidate division KSB1 bacterium]